MYPTHSHESLLAGEKAELTCTVYKNEAAALVLSDALDVLMKKGHIKCSTINVDAASCGIWQPLKWREGIFY